MPDSPGPGAAATAVFSTEELARLLSVIPCLHRAIHPRGHGDARRHPVEIEGSLRLSSQHPTPRQPFGIPNMANRKRSVEGRVADDRLRLAAVERRTIAGDEAVVCAVPPAASAHGRYG